MIKLVPNPKFDCPVKLTVPDQSDPVEITMSFRHMTAAKSAEWFEAGKDKQLDEAVGEIVCGWTGVVAEDGSEVAYSQENLRQLLVAYQPAALEIIRAWQIGLTESRVKN